MRFPGFNAESSLYRNGKIYLTTVRSEVSSNEASSIIAQGCSLWDKIVCYFKTKDCLDKWGDNYPCVMKCLGRNKVYDCWDCIVEQITCTSSRPPTCSTRLCPPMGNLPCCRGYSCRGGECLPVQGGCEGKPCRRDDDCCLAHKCVGGRCRGL